MWTCECGLNFWVLVCIMTTNVYVLKLADDCWYIGKAGDVEKRIEQHNGSSGSAWTRLHKPIRVETIIKDVSPFDEDRYTKEYMAKYGIDKVRGGSYVTGKLDKQQLAFLQREIWGAQDLCFLCGGNHFVRFCKKSKGVAKEIEMVAVTEPEDDGIHLQTAEEMEENNRKCRDAAGRFCAYIGRCIDGFFGVSRPLPPPESHTQHS